MGDISRPAVYIIGAYNLQNELMTGLLDQELGVTCSNQPNIEAIAATIVSAGREPNLILWDCLGTNLDDLWKGLHANSSSFLLRTPVALINVRRKMGVEKLAISNGLQGIFFVDDSVAILLKGIKAILDGELWFPRDIMMNHLKEPRNIIITSGRALSALTVKQKEVLLKLASGSSNEEIASAMNISPNTVKTHIYNIYTKIGVSNRLQAALWATKNFR